MYALCDLLLQHMQWLSLSDNLHRPTKYKDKLKI